MEYALYKRSECMLSWTSLTKDYVSSPPDFMRLIDKFYQNKDKQVDLRPYMILEPYTVDLKDSQDKTLYVFRMNHLRHLPVVDKRDYSLQGIITR